MYLPICLYDIDEIMRSEVLVPNCVVVRSGPGPKSSPWRDQVMLKGSSPFITEQIICRGSPWFTASSPNVKGSILGGSKINKIQMSNIIKHLPVPITHKITIDFQFCGIRCGSSSIACKTCKFSRVSI